MKLRVGILCGGRSAEHEVSLASAKSVIDALDKEKYEVRVIGIDKSGAWHLRDSARFVEHAEDPKRIQLHAETTSEVLIPKSEDVDVIFPVLHGPYGEDGTIQG